MAGSTLQRDAALRRANTIRRARAMVKRFLRARPFHLVELLEYYDATGTSVRNGSLCGAPYMQGYAESIGDDLGLVLWASFLDGMRVEELVSATRGFGPHRTRRLLAEAGMSTTTTMGGSTVRQRAAIAAAIRSKLTP